MSTTARTIDPEHQMLGEVEMVGRDRWEEIRRRAGAGASIRAIARALDVDRKTVRRLLRQKQWKPYPSALRGRTRCWPRTLSSDVQSYALRRHPV